MAEPIGGALWRTPKAWAFVEVARDARSVDAGTRGMLSRPSRRRGSPPRVRPRSPGYVAVVAKQHVVEPFELPPSAGRAFWNDVMLVAKCVAELFSPVKMNYELHGNTVPHLHVHIYPRYRDDPYVGGPIDPRRATFARSREELLRIGRVIRNARYPRRRGRSPRR